MAFKLNSAGLTVGSVAPAGVSRRIQWLSVTWAGFIVAGMVGLLNYSSAPGAVSTPPRSWPKVSGLSLHPSRLTMIMFLHPRCPCSTASVNELARLSARAKDRMEIVAVFVIPPGCPPDWHQSNLWDTAKRIPGVHCLSDHDARICSQFHVTTSGHCLVYNPKLKLIFSGGITAGRGHEGDSLGQTMIAEKALKIAEDGLSECATFGCPLINNQPNSKSIRLNGEAGSSLRRP